MSPQRPLKVLIAGCGIGGITLALALRQRGLDYVVLEQADELREVGAGIQLSANATRLLDRLGVLAPLKEIAVAPEGLDIRSYRDGARILWTPLGEVASARFGAPYLHAHRADFLSILAQALAMDRVRLGARCANARQDSDGVQVTLESGEVVEGDVLVGADGIHSLIRDTLFPPPAMRHSGTAWRGTVAAMKVRHLGIEKNTNVWWGPERCVVHYYISGAAVLNWIGIVPYDESSVESWSAKGEIGQCLEEFRGWHDEITGLIGASDTVFKWALHDREPLARWTEGRITLIGDAAHAMLPYHAQGACMSIEDAYVLAAQLACAGGAPERALQEYEALRRPRASWVQRYSRAAEAHFTLADPDAVSRRDARLRASQGDYSSAFPPGQQRIYGYDADKPEDPALVAATAA